VATKCAVCEGPTPEGEGYVAQGTKRTCWPCAVGKGRAARQEWLVAAFLAETGLKASEAELVEQRAADGSVSWFLRRREP
jgi:hypothetical protein